jgi:hypothetical protein
VKSAGMPKPKPDRTPMKYSPVEVAPLPATLEEQTHHLRGFIERFVASGRRARWTHCLLDSPDKACEHLHRFGTDQEARHCTELSGADCFPRSLEAALGQERGIYFDGITAPCKVTAAEAATMATEHFRDALLSYVPGRRVLFFDHEGAVWLCERP